MFSIWILVSPQKIKTLEWYANTELVYQALKKNFFLVILKKNRYVQMMQDEEW